MSLKKLAGATAIYGISSIFGRLINFALTPYYTNLFPPEEYAIISLLLSGVAFAFVFFTYRMELAYFRFGTDKNEDRNQIFNVSLSSIVFSTIGLVALIVLIAPYISVFWEIPDKTNLIYFCAAILAFDALNEIPKAKLRLDSRPIRFAIVQLSSILTNIIIVFFFLWFCPLVLAGDSFSGLKPFIEKIYSPDFGLGYVFVANIIGSGVAFLLLLPEWKSFKLLIDKVLWKKMMVYSLPMVIVGLSFIINEMFDRTFMIKLLPGTPEENKIALGIYSANYKIAMLLALFTQAFRYGAEPFFFKQKDAKDSLESYAVIAKYFLIISVFAFLSVTLYIDFFKHLLRKPVYWEGLQVVPVLLLANLFLGMYYNFSVWFKITDRTKYGAYISVSGAILTIVLNVWWLPVYGYIGSAWATLICYFSMTIACVILGRKFLKVPYQLNRMSFYLAIGISFFFLAAFAENMINGNLLIKTSVNSIIILFFIGIVWFLERKELKKHLLE